MRQGDSKEYHVKANILSFNGSLPIEKFLDWFSEVKRFLVSWQLTNSKVERLFVGSDAANKSQTRTRLRANMEKDEAVDDGLIPSA